MINEELVGAVSKVLRSDDVKLGQQYIVRTDYQPGPYSDSPGLHMDHSCLPWQYEASPSQHYFLAMVALNDIESGGAATLVSPESLNAAQATAARLQEEERDWCLELKDEDFRNDLRVKLSSTRPEQPELVEILCERGDCAIIDPMMLHAAMPMRHPGMSRYVCFNTFFDASAAGPAMRPTRGATEPAVKYPDELRFGLPPSIRGILDWALPESERTQAERMWEVVGASSAKASVAKL